MVSLEKKTAFVTGGAQGLGHGYVQRFLEEGANVFYGDINETLGRSTEAEFVSKFGKDRVMFFPFDVTDSDKFKEAFDQAVSHFGQVDVMVNNAGVMNEGIWKKMIQINCTGVVQGTMLAMEHMRKDKGGKGGRIINISSMIGLNDTPSVPVYAGTKHFVRCYSSSIAMTPGLESEMGIDIAILCPDVTDTDLVTKLDDSKFLNYNEQWKQQLDKLLNPISLIVDGLFSILHREKVNGAIYLPSNKGSAFKKMECVDLGSEWPPVKSTE